MAFTQLPEQTIPSQQSGDTEWIAWYKNLRNTVGKDEANPLFMRVWSQRGTNEANTDELRTYLAKNGITLKEDWQDIVIDTLTSPLDALSWGLNFGKTMLYIGVVFACLVLLAIVYMLFNIGKHPDKVVSAATKFI